MKVFKIILAALLLAICALNAIAAETSEVQSSKIWVVAIGVGKYQRPQFQALSYAVEGARKFAQAVQDANPTNANAIILTSDSTDMNLVPTKTNVIRTVNELSRKVTDGDMVMFYFIGHGVAVEGQQRLLLMDADLTDKDTTEASTIQLSGLREKLEALPATGKLVFLDACRESPRQSGGVYDSTPMTNDFLRAGADWNPAKGKVACTFFGCQEGEKVYYGSKGQSFFTEALVEGLAGKACDPAGQVTLRSLAEYVQTKVPKTIKDELGPNSKQLPVMMPLPSTPVILRPSPGYIAVPNFAGKFGDLYADKVQTRLAESGTLLLVERTLLSSAVSELRIQDSGITDPETAAKLGKMINAKYVLVGQAQETPDGKIRLSVRLVEVATGRNFPGIAAESTFAAGDWENAVQSTADQLYNKMIGTSVMDKNKAVAKPKVTPVVKQEPKPQPKPDTSKPITKPQPKPEKKPDFL